MSSSSTVKKVSQNKKIFIILGLIALLVIFLVILKIDADRKKEPGYTIEYIDKDTGETRISRPNQTPENQGSNTETLILGLNNLTKHTLRPSDRQIALFKNDLSFSGLTYLPAHDSTVKIIDSSFNIDTGILKADLLYQEEGRKTVGLEIDLLSHASERGITYKLIDSEKTIYSSPVLKPSTN